MRIHRVRLREIGSFLVGSAFRKQLQDLAFARSEKIVAIFHLLVAYLANLIFQQHCPRVRVRVASKSGYLFPSEDLLH